MAENQVSKVITIYVGLTFFNPTPVNLSIFSQGLTAFSVFGRKVAGPTDPAKNYEGRRSYLMQIIWYFHIYTQSVSQSDLNAS